MVLNINAEMECPDLFHRIRVCLPNINVASVTCACLPKINVASVAFPRATQDCLHVPALTHCVSVSAMAALHSSWDVAIDKESDAEMPDPGWGMGNPHRPWSP